MSQISDIGRHVIVSQESVNEDADALLLSNMNVVNAMFDEHLSAEEISDTALKSYYVDFYTSQMATGGFEQFILASAMDEDVISYITEGLEEIGATEHLELFKRFLSTFENLGEDAQEYFLSDDEDDEDDYEDSDVEDDYSDDDAETDADEQDAYEAGRRLLDGEDPVSYAGDDAEDEDADLETPYDEDLESVYAGSFDELDGAYDELASTSDLAEANAAWLKKHPDLKALPAEEIDAEIAAFAESLPDIDERRAAADEDDEELEEYEALIIELADVADQELEEIIGRDSEFEWQGEIVGGWRFTTDEGEFIMIDDEERALMIDVSTRQPVAEIEFEEE